MTNLECMAIREFRRFAVSHIYPDTINMIITDIQNAFKSDNIEFEQLPQPIIKFNCKSGKDANNSIFLGRVHLTLKTIFITYFNDQEIIKMIRNRIHNNIVDDETKQLLNLALSEIQLGNPQYVCLLFNITTLGENVYVYL